MTVPGLRYVVVTPARDESAHIERTIDAMCASARCSASLTKGPAGSGQSGTAAAIWKNGSSNPLRVGPGACAALAAAVPDRPPPAGPFVAGAEHRAEAWLRRSRPGRAACRACSRPSPHCAPSPQHGRRTTRATRPRRRWGCHSPVRGLPPSEQDVADPSRP